MAGRVDDFERTMAFADIAFGQMKALRQPASPRNFEIWYAYASGYHPALNQQINATLKAKGTISEADLVQMYENFLSPTRLTERIDLVGSQVKGEIDQVMAMIDARHRAASTLERQRRFAHNRRNARTNVEVATDSTAEVA